MAHIGSVTSDFYCTKCGHKGIPIARKIGQERKSGHLKKLYCLHCQEETNHVEIKDNGEYTYQDFLQEYQLGRFVHGERVDYKDLHICDKENCPYNVNGLCWNASNSFLCGYRK